MICKRAGCGMKENRINGYCSVYCEDMFDLEKKLLLILLLCKGRPDDPLAVEIRKVIDEE